MLWKRSLVMRDVETGSLWSHLLGKCMRGKLEGQELELLPGVMTNWQEWRERYPDTKVLGMSRTAKRYVQGIWENPGRYVFGIPLGAGRLSPAVAIKKLMRAPVVNLDAAGQSVLVTFSPEGQRAQAFDREHDGKTLRFESDGAEGMRDLGTGSTWDAVTGKCVKGQLKGRKLTLRPGTISYREAWRNFFPKGQITD